MLQLEIPDAVLNHPSHLTRIPRPSISEMIAISTEYTGEPARLRGLVLHDENIDLLIVAGIRIGGDEIASCHAPAKTFCALRLDDGAAPIVYPRTSIVLRITSILVRKMIVVGGHFLLEKVTER